MKARKVKDITSNEEVLVQPGPAVKPSEKVDFIRAGKKKKTITKFEQNKNVTYRNEGDKIIVVEKEKKFDETGVSRKKRNYVMYESILGTEKERDTTKITAKKGRKPKPRVEERIYMKKKKREILDNYQYLETKVMREPAKASFVFHQRLGPPIGKTYETKTFERQVYRMNDTKSRSRPSSTNQPRNYGLRPSSTTQSRNRNTGYKPSLTQLKTNNPKLRKSSTSSRNSGGRPASTSSKKSAPRQSSNSNRNRPKINVSNVRHFKTQSGTISNFPVRNRRPMVKAVTSQKAFKRVYRK